LVSGLRGFNALTLAFAASVAMGLDFVVVMM
jgi:hypothetical protein